MASRLLDSDCVGCVSFVDAYRRLGKSGAECLMNAGQQSSPLCQWPGCILCRTRWRELTALAPPPFEGCPSTGLLCPRHPDMHSYAWAKGTGDSISGGLGDCACRVKNRQARMK
jgi:hypothetical protein